MASLSAVLITKNESGNLTRCVEALGFTDEILVLDTGSEDGTPELAASLGCRVELLPVWQGFGPAKQRAVELASHDWILSVDADEVLSHELQKELQGLAQRDFEGCAWRLKRRSFYRERPIRFCGWQNDAPLRVFNRQQGTFNAYEVHEGVRTRQETRFCSAYLYHYTYPTRATHLEKMRLYGELGARRLHERGQRSGRCSALLRALYKFLRMYLLQLGILDGARGLRLCLDSAWGLWYKYHFLWKLGR